jgi:predicted HTH domain antitoxin
MSHVQIRIDADVTEFLGDSPEQIERSAQEFIVLELYRRHTISAGRAAELLGLEEFAFIRWSGSLGIPYMDATPEELRQELQFFKNG